MHEKSLNESKQLREAREAREAREVREARERRDFNELAELKELKELKEREKKQEQEIRRLSELSETQRKVIELAEAAKSSGAAKGSEFSKERRSQLQRAIDLLKSCLSKWSIDSTVRDLIDASKAVVSGLGSSTFEALKSDHSFRNTTGASIYIGNQLDHLAETSRSLVCFLGSEVLCSTKRCTRRRRR